MKFARRQKVSVYNNNITVIGNIGKEAEIKEISGVGSVARFPLAVYRSGKGEESKTDWFFVEAWHDLARGAANLDKGNRVIVTGQMKADQKTTQGSKTTYYSIVANNIGKDISISKDDDEPF